MSALGQKQTLKRLQLARNPKGGHSPVRLEFQLSATTGHFAAPDGCLLYPSKRTLIDGMAIYEVQSGT